MGNIVTITGGFPFTPIVGQDRALSGVITQSHSTYANLNTAAVSNQFTLSGQSVPYNWIPYDPNTVILGHSHELVQSPDVRRAAAWELSPMAPRDILRGPGVGTWNLSINKDTKLGFLGEQGVIEFRAEIFNLLNRANFGPPSNTVFAGNISLNNLAVNTLNSQAGGNIQTPTGATPTSPLGTVGQITTTATTSRQIQLALKVIF